MKKNVLITGANRGIGLEFVKQYAADGWRVFATCRNPQKADELKQLAEADDISVYPMEVTNDESIRAVKKELGNIRLDHLINNAGVYGPRHLSFGTLDFEAWEQVIRVNTFGPVRVSQIMVDLLGGNTPSVIANVTSKMGSIDDNTSGGSYIYRTSKVALNMATRSMAHDLADRGIICVILHPGWVQTDMGGPAALISTQQSVSGMRSVIQGLSPQDTSGFFNYDGSVIPW